jgi:hypothetical protein
VAGCGKVAVAEGNNAPDARRVVEVLQHAVLSPHDDRAVFARRDDHAHGGQRRLKVAYQRRYIGDALWLAVLSAQRRDQ